MLYEISRISVPAIKSDEILLAWHNGTLAVRTDSGIQFFDISHEVYSLEKKINWLVSFIPNSKNSPANDLSLEAYAKKNRSNLELTQMVLDPGLWPYNAHYVQNNATTVDLKWSPVGVICNNQSFLAVLNNVGNVDIYGPYRGGWICVLNMSEGIKELVFTSKDIDTVPANFEVLKQRVDAVESCAICWGPRIDNKSCYFVTAQRNGKILFWKIHNHSNEVLAELLSEMITELAEIITMLWIKTSDNNFTLACTDALGQLHAFHCRTKNNIEVLSASPLWTHKDRMVAKFLYHIMIEDNHVLIYNKHRHLVVQMFDKNFTLQSQIVKNVNDHRITSITYSNSIFYLSTVNWKIYKVLLKIANNELIVELDSVQTKDPYSTFELYCISHSTNKVIWALAMNDRKVQYNKNQDTHEIGFFCADLHQNEEVSLLLNNPTKMLTDYWDLIELLRYKTMKTKCLPDINYAQLQVNGNEDKYTLKLFWIFTILYNNLEKKVCKNSKGWLPETSSVAVKDKIHVNYAKEAMNEIYALYESNNQMLDCLQLSTYDGARKFIKYYCSKYEKNIDEFIEPYIWNAIKNESQYTCQCCDDVIEGFTCKSGHLNMYCIKTFTLIDGDDYLICKSCQSTARKELYANNPICVFCDLYLDNCHLPS